MKNSLEGSGSVARRSDGQAWLKRILLLATVLLASMGMLDRSVCASSTEASGFDRKLASPEPRRSFYEQVGEGLNGLAQETEPMVAQYIDSGKSNDQAAFRTVGEDQANSAQLASALFDGVTPGFFSALKTVFAAGLAFERRGASDASLAATFSAFVKQFLPNTVVVTPACTKNITRQQA